MSDRHWSNLQETTSVFGIKLLYWIFRLGGRTTFMLTLWPVIIGYWLAVPRVRHASADYFDRLHKSGHFPSKPSIFHQFRHIFHFADTILDSLEVLELKLSVDDTLIAYWVYATINVRNILILEAAQHVDNSICITNICQELITEALTL